MITLRERTMLRFMNAVTDKPHWEKKVGGFLLYSDSSLSVFTPPGV